MAVVPCGPSSVPRIRVTDACPFEPVWVTALETLPPPWAAQVTCTSGTGFPLSSVTSTTSGLGRGCPTTPFWPLPPPSRSSWELWGGHYLPRSEARRQPPAWRSSTERTFRTRLIITMTMDPLQGVRERPNGWREHGRRCRYRARSWARSLGVSSLVCAGYATELDPPLRRRHGSLTAARHPMPAQNGASTGSDVCRSQGNGWL